MAKFDYWQECLASSFDEHGIVVTPEQLVSIAGDVEGAHENYGMSHYQPSSSDRYQPQIDKLKRELAAERDKVHCQRCDGRGREITQGPYHGSNSQCSKCHGEGRHAP